MSLNQNKTSIIWQQIVAVDVKYTSYRNVKLKTLYIKRRNQLIGKIAKNGLNPYRKQYLNIRCKILAHRYGVSSDQLSIRSKYSNNRSTSKLDDSFEYKRFQKDFINVFPHPLEAIDSLYFDYEKIDDHEKDSLSEDYAFTGMHHIFDQHKDAVTGVKFANNDKSLLACSSLDGTLSICQLTPSPATVLYILTGHTSGVCQFEWSISNDLIVSCSYDGSVKLWDPTSGSCLRTIKDSFDSPVLACTFQPVNNNMVVTGNDKGYIQILNVSTGIYTKDKIINHGGILCLSFDSYGKILWAGDSKGCITSFVFEIQTCRLIKANKILLVAGCPISCISSFTHRKNDSCQLSILVNSACNSLIYFKISTTGQLEIKQNFPIKHQNNELMIKSSFCPIASHKDKICIVSGSEDTCVYFFNIEDNPQTKSKYINKLQGHCYPVLDVCFNYDESLLASSDTKGNIIIWKKETI